ncbi:unnamed protein product [Symbiodinium pilosum]|uniref:Ion transport domain-containing protein n=1 Tax=Symbiodinium pilosum TaxID=2952 RepID=A0A812X3C9_SYMPI|nr:unnamed protein product [Symbiodinium pilosum]
MIVYSVSVEPFRICFGVEVSSAMLALDIFVDCLFVIDIVLTFFTAYFDEREVLVTNRLRIAKRYLRGFFVIDVASVFPAELFLLAIQPDIATQARAVKLLRLVRLMKLGRLFKLKRLVLLVEEKLNFSLQMMDMLKMLVKVLFIVHWLACLTYLVASPVCEDGSPVPCPPPKDPDDGARFWSNWVRMFQADKFDLALGPRNFPAAAIASEFWEQKALIEARLAQIATLPPVEYRGPSPAEQCVSLDAAELEQLQRKDAFFSRLPTLTLPAVAAFIGAVALTPLRRSSRAHAQAFAIHHFVPRSHAAVQQFRWEEDARQGYTEDLERPDLDDEDDFAHAMDFADATFSKVEVYAVDDAFLSMRRKGYESESEHRLRLNWFFENTFVHLGDDPAHYLALQRCCRQFPKVSALVFPNHVYSPPGGVFCPRPLHVAILAQDMALAKMLLRAALETRCNGDTVFLRSHTPNTNWGEMSPVFLALLVVSTETLAEWLKLLCAAGARLNHMDWHIYRVIQCADLPDGTEEKEALKERLEFALDLLHHSGQRGRYLSTFHFITATLMAVGYGDIFPANSFERIVCIISQITGAVLFGFLLSCITAVMEFTHPRELEHKKRMSEIKNWLRNRSLPPVLKAQAEWVQGPIFEVEV